MDMNENIGVYAEAKGEYTRQLSQFIVPALQEYFLELVEDAKTKDADPKKLLWSFQNLLKEIPDWNADKVQRETGRILTLTKCDYLEELLTAVFIAHTKVLSAIRLSSKQNKKLQITIPKLDHFLHRTMSDSGRILWSNVYLFTPTGTPIDRQKNLNTVEGLLNEAVLQSIRSMLPVKNILREYLHDDGEDEVEAPAAAAVAAEAVTVPTPVPAPEPVVDVSGSAPVIDVSGAALEPAPTPAPAPAPEPTPTPAAEPVVIAPAPAPTPAPAPAPAPAAAPAEQQAQQTIVVDTEPSVRFTNINSVFHPDDPERNNLEEVDTIDNYEPSDEMLQFTGDAPEGLSNEHDYEEL
uniref:Uncharacterized protein n=1 Tax=viral metagenome TaxID=1070528 RepID=A0A6C0BAL2_9ZZZZ